jgi:hypothetical protein
MNRRKLIEGMLAAAGACVVSGGALADDWRTVAHVGRNRNSRYYGPDALEAMRFHSKGAMVLAREPETPGLPVLEALAGVITAARIEREYLRVQMRWFSGVTPPAGLLFLTPSGVGDLVCPFEGDQTCSKVTGYRLEHFVLNKESAFMYAEPL